MSIIDFPSWKAAIAEDPAPETRNYYEPKERPIPRPIGWMIQCPGCAEELEYRPTSEDFRTYEHDPAEWPVCDACEMILEPETIEIRVIPTTKSPPLASEDNAE